MLVRVFFFFIIRFIINREFYWWKCLCTTVHGERREEIKMPLLLRSATICLHYMKQCLAFGMMVAVCSVAWLALYNKILLKPQFNVFAYNYTCIIRIQHRFIERVSLWTWYTIFIIFFLSFIIEIKCVCMAWDPCRT